MLCTCKYKLSILWPLIIILSSAVNILQHLKAIWGLGSVPKPTGGKKKPNKTLKLVEKVLCIIRLLKQQLLKETLVFLSLADYAKSLFAFLKNG